MSLSPRLLALRDALTVVDERKWSAADLGYLCEAYKSAVIDIRAIAQKMGRTHASVAVKASRLGLGKQSRPRREQQALKFDTPLSPEDRRARQSAMQKERIASNGHPRGMLGKQHSAETKEALSVSSRAMWADPASKINSPAASQRRSDSLIARLKAGQMRPKYSRSRGGKRDDLGGVYFRSSWEANYARYLSWLQRNGEVTSWEFEPKTFVFEAIKRGTRAYTPDFRVVLATGAVEWHEVKGWMDGKSRTRLARMKKYFPDEKVVLKDAKFFRWLNSSIVAKNIPGWETGREPRGTAAVQVSLYAAGTGANSRESAQPTEMVQSAKRRDSEARRAVLGDSGGGVENDSAD